MLSDESSSDSETGRFKCRSKTQDESSKSRKEDSFRSSIRSRADDKFQRDIDKSKSDRDRFDRYPRDRDRNRFSRNSPIRRRSSRERSPVRKSPDRHRHERDSRGVKPPGRSDSRERSKHSRSRLQRSPERKRDLKEEIRRNITPRAKSPEIPRRRSKDRELDKARIPVSPDKSQKRGRVSISPVKSHRRERIVISPEKSNRRDRVQISPEKSHRRDKVSISPEKSFRRDRNSPDRGHRRERLSVTPDHKGKRSEIYKPPPAELRKIKSESPIVIEEHSDPSDEVQPGSYYKMIPAVVKDKSEESSEIDSSDDEKLRAKLLNLEKELHKTKKKKHKKKHRKKHSKSEKDSDQDTSAVVEVTSTTDIPNVKAEERNTVTEPAEVSSTQKSSQKESGEEGEIISDDDSQNQYEIDPTDLRHKLKRSVAKSDNKKDFCGPALPPSLTEKRSQSPITEGPALPPHLKGKSRHIGIYIMFSINIPNCSSFIFPDIKFFRKLVKYMLHDQHRVNSPLSLTLCNNTYYFVISRTIYS